MPGSMLIACQIFSHKLWIMNKESRYVYSNYVKRACLLWVCVSFCLLPFRNQPLSAMQDLFKSREVVNFLLDLENIALSVA